MTKLQAAVIGAVAVGVVLTPFVVQHQARLRRENESLRQQLAQLKADNEGLADQVVQLKSAPASRRGADDRCLRLHQRAGPVGRRSSR